MHSKLPAVIAVALGLVGTTARAEEGPDVVVRVRFTTQANADAIQHAACALDARAAVRVERKDAVALCKAPAEAKQSLVVHIIESGDDKREVVLDMDLGQESMARANELLDALAITSADLEKQLPAPPRRTRPLSTTLTTLGIVLGGVGLGTVIASYIWTAVLLIQPKPCSQPLSVQVPIFGSCVSASDYLQTEVLAISGYATIGLGATLALIGQVRVAVVPVVTPVRGGFTGGLTLVF